MSRRSHGEEVDEFRFSEFVLVLLAVHYREYPKTHLPHGLLSY